MTIDPDVIFAICGMSLYAIGFVVAGYKGLLRKRKNNMGCGMDKDVSCCEKNIKVLYSVIEIYSIAIITCVDFIADVTITIRWLSKDGTRNLGILSASVLLLQRFVSALVFGEKGGWRTGIRQFFDFEVFKKLMVSIEFNRPVYGLKKYKILEGLLESFPQLLMQLYYLVKRSSDTDDSNLLLLHISILTSLFSLALCYLFSDVVGIHRESDTDHFKRKLMVWLCYGFLGIWRFGEVATRICVLVAFASVVSAKWGTLCLSSFLFTFNSILMKQFPESSKATMFYRRRGKKELLNRDTLVTNSCVEMVSTNTNTEHLPKRAGVRITISQEKMYDMDRTLSKFSSTLCAQQESTSSWNTKEIAYKMKKVIFRVVNGLGEATFASLALPSLLPRKFVLLYYTFKFVFEGSLIALCIYTTDNTLNKPLDLFRILSHEVFKDIWWYWWTGAVCFVFGGALSFCVISTDHWKNVLRAVDDALLTLMESKQYSFVERVLGLGGCTVKNITERALVDMTGIKPTDKKAVNDFVTNQPYCKLLCLMLRQRIVNLGPKHRILRKEQAKSKKYECYVVPSLLSSCNDIRWQTIEGEFAKAVLNRILGNDQNAAKNLKLVEIRNAGASLAFLRFHLNAPKNLFTVGGAFNCTAKELKAEKFDLLYCLQCGFSPKELIKVGYKKNHVEDSVFKNPDNCNVKILRKFGHELFEMHFTVRQLNASNDIEDSELLDWYRQHLSYLSKKQGNFLITPTLRSLSEGTSSTGKVKKKNTLWRHHSTTELSIVLDEAILKSEITDLDQKWLQVSAYDKSADYGSQDSEMQEKDYESHL